MNTEAELIASICKSKDIAKALEARIEDKMYTHRDVFEWVREYYFKHREVPDIALVHEHFPDIEPVDPAGTTSYYVERVSEIHLEKLIGRMIEGVAREHGTTPAPELLTRMMGWLNKTARENNIIKDAMVNDIDAATNEFLRRATESANAGGSRGIHTGFKVFDSDYPTGLSEGHLITLIGWSGRGKSLMATKLALEAWLQNKRVLFVSLEMTAAEVRDRVFTLSGDGRFRHSELSRGQVDVDEFGSWATESFGGLEDFVIVSPQGSSSITPSIIQSKIEQYNADICFVDYVQLMDADNDDSYNETVKLKNISRDLKLMAVSNSLPIVMLSQATFSDPKETDEPPLIEQVAWSKGIQNDSDLAVAVHKYTDSNVFDIVARKNRHGELFAFQLDWDIDMGQLREKF